MPGQISAFALSMTFVPTALLRARRSCTASQMQFARARGVRNSAGRWISTASAARIGWVENGWRRQGVK